MIPLQTAVANLTKLTIGTGGGLSGGAGYLMGFSFNYSNQILVSPNGQVALMESISAPVFPLNAVVWPGGLGGYGGLQLTLSNAQTPPDLASSGVGSLNYGVGGGKGLGGGIDVSLGSGTQGQNVLQLTFTLGGGLGGYGHGVSPVTTTVTPMCPR